MLLTNGGQQEGCCVRGAGELKSRGVGVLLALAAAGLGSACASISVAVCALASVLLHIWLSVISCNLFFYTACQDVLELRSVL